MTPKCTKLIIFSALLVLKIYGVQAQKYLSEENQDFLSHLARERLYTERIFLLSQFADHDAKMTLEKAWTFGAVHMYDSSVYHYSRIPLDTIVHYSFHNAYLSTLFLGSRLHSFSKHVRKLHTSSQMDSTHHISLRLMELGYEPAELKKVTNNGNLSRAYADYYKFDRKSPILAGLYAALIPGSGKAYTGKWRQGLNAFISNAVLGLQTYEAYQKAGIDSPRFYIFGGLFSLFYIGNIYGSIINVNKSKAAFKHQLHYEVSNYYYSNILHPHYR